MSWIPSFKLYQDDGSTLLYTFEHVIETNWPQDAPSHVEHTNLRSQGAIIIPGGDKAWDLELNGILTASDYTTLTTEIFNIKNTIVNNTRYVLKIDKSQSTFDSIKVTRLEPITFQGPNRRTNIQYYTIRFRAESWA